jgi:hypothetical protein
MLCPYDDRAHTEIPLYSIVDERDSHNERLGTKNARPIGGMLLYL